MADYRLYLDKPDEGRLGMSTRYEYEDSVLLIEWCGERQWHYLPPHTAVIVKCQGCMPEVVALEWPKVFRWRVMWLCGVKKKGRCATMAEYEQVVQQYEASHITHIGGKGWQVALHHGKNGRFHPVATWINGRLTNAEVHKMVDACCVTVPDWFRKQVLGF